MYIFLIPHSFHYLYQYLIFMRRAGYAELLQRLLRAHFRNRSGHVFRGRFDPQAELERFVFPLRR